MCHTHTHIYILYCCIHNPIHFQVIRTHFVYAFGFNKIFNSMITFTLLRVLCMCIFPSFSSTYFTILIRHEHTFSNTQNDTFPLYQTNYLMLAWAWYCCWLPHRQMIYCAASFFQKYKQNKAKNEKKRTASPTIKMKIK